MNPVRTILSVTNLSAGYNGSTVINNVSFELKQGEILGLIGQNGCGKSTLLKAIFGLTPNISGTIVCDDKNISKKEPYELLKNGIAYFVQGGMIFPRLTVQEHLISASLNGTPKSYKASLTLIGEIYSRFPLLVDCRNKRGGNLSGGQRQILSFAMLLTGKPKRIWLLDEPTAGLAPELVDYTTNFIKEINEKENISIILVEHNYIAALEMSDNLIIMKEGNISEKFTNEQIKQKEFLQEHLYN